MADIFETIGDWLGLNKGKATQKAAEQNRGVIDQMGNTGRPIIEGIQGVTGDYLDLGKLGAGLYSDAMGLNGAEGITRAQDSFRAAPGYQFALDQGLDAVARKGSAMGRLDSGNTDLDLMRYATGYADQAWGNWMNGLSGYNNMYGQGVANDVTARGLGLDFESGLATNYMGANNQVAAGKEAGQGAMLDALGAVAGIAGRAFGGGSFGGYGGFGGNSVNPTTKMPASF
ncbi:hypothetical protein ASC89_27305 [Devosia sp. Root413D1]|uniref:hypothetical protein n=1 Tax=unclassified Devosia TaxID=196773 RepID=UPI0006F24FC7|nr:hypothetical protein [Devosia sp. Root413D1]KQW74111.1 hypothetical protein ASC89_27305 [Devosia sp. Root413D1]